MGSLVEVVTRQVADAAGLVVVVGVGVQVVSGL